MSLLSFLYYRVIPPPRSRISLPSRPGRSQSHLSTRSSPTGLWPPPPSAGTNTVPGRPAPPAFLVFTLIREGSVRPEQLPRNKGTSLERSFIPPSVPSHSRAKTMGLVTGIDFPSVLTCRGPQPGKSTDLFFTCCPPWGTARHSHRGWSRRRFGLLPVAYLYPLL